MIEAAFPGNTAVQGPFFTQPLTSRVPVCGRVA